MQDTLLRVFAALILLTYPRDDPGFEEWDNVTSGGMERYEEGLMRGEDKLDHEKARVSEEMMHTDGDDIKNTPKEQNQSDQHGKDQMSVLEDGRVTKQNSEEDSADHKLPEGGHFVAKSDPLLPKISRSEPGTSQIDQELEGNLQQDMKNKEGEHIQNDGSGRPQGQQEKLEEREVTSSEEQESPLSHLHTKTSENETSERVNADWESELLWYIWNMFSVISMIRFFRKYLGRSSQKKQEETRACTSAEVPLPDRDTLQLLHSKCVKVSADNKWKGEFLEGFANDLLDAMRTDSVRNGGMLIGDAQVVDVCDFIVPFTPPNPYSFQCLLSDNQASDLLADLQVCGQIKLVENKEIQNGCHCQTPDADDMVCLLHCETEKVKTVTDVCDGLLCMKNSTFLSKLQVTRWFQSTIKQAWARISHKYDFELTIRYMDAPGALQVRFRSGKKISFTMNPVVKFNADAHFFITPSSPNNLDALWTLSLMSYEDSFLKLISQHLPRNSCHMQTLEIASFLHKRQTALSGSSGLKFSHFKIALMHLLLTKDPSQWNPSHVVCRLRDLLDFMERSLEKKLLHHVLIGNPLTQKVIELPAEFTKAKTVNLFHPLVVHNCIYKNAVMHFQEMLQNSHLLINDCV
ncbi:inositol 1,4,5-trisphosphate receptor-interacting protein [Pempheris klunzingeri]|uniref:inositol 1,4,5-trisphosphate receptor-interacting protein n=1 Tax=Pempheris klunzingeri TaxID=3127111 RepID=UPI00398007CF